MTVALKKVFTELTKMPAPQQNAIAALLNEELTWQSSFENSQDGLAMLAAEAITEYKKGKTKALGFK